MQITKAPKGTIVTKAMESDKREVLSKNLQGWYLYGGESLYAYLLDYDDTYVYWDVYDYHFGSYVIYRATYTFNGTDATFGDDVVEVTRQTTYAPVEYLEKSAEGTTLNKILKALESLTGASGAKDKASSEGLVYKQFNDEQMIAIEVLYCPPNVPDLEGDMMESETIYKMVEGINEKIEKGELISKYSHKDETDDFYFIKSWVAECDCYIGDHFIVEGTPLMKVQFTDADAWEARKSGNLLGLSIGGSAGSTEDL